MRVSDSGLGCGPGGSGFHGWPFCNGDVVPGLDLNTVIEYTPPGARRDRRDPDRRARRAGRGGATGQPRAGVRPRSPLVLLVLAQAVLGGATVEENLEEAPRGRPPGPRDAPARRPDAVHLALHAARRCSAPSRRRAGAASGRWPWSRRVLVLLHDRGRRLHGRDPELRPRRLPARRRRPPRLRQGVPDLQRRLHALRPVAAGGHPPDPPRRSCTSPRCWPIALVAAGPAAPPEPRRGPRAR